MLFFESTVRNSFRRHRLYGIGLTSALVLSCVGLTPERPQVVTPSSSLLEPSPLIEAAAVEPPLELPVFETPTIPEVSPPLTLTEAANQTAELLHAGDKSTALTVLEAAVTSSDGETSQLDQLRAAILISQGKIEEAKEIARRLSQANPQNAEAVYVLAVCEGALGNQQEVKALLERAIAIDPQHVGALSALGSFYLAAKSYVSSEAFFDRSLALSPEDAEALIGKARVRRYQNDFLAAEKALTTAITAYPDWPLPLTERSRIYRETNRLTDALADLNTALELDALDYWSFIDRGNLYIDLGRVAEALADFKWAASLNPDYFLSYAYSAGLREAAGDWAGAESDYERLAVLKPEYYFANEALGLLRMRDGRWDEAAEAFIEAYMYSPSRLDYALLIALNWLKADNAKVAKPFLAKLLPTIPRESPEYYIVRLYHDQAGDTDMAKRIDKETDKDSKARMLFYLAQYYAVRGNDGLAAKYFLMVRELNRRNLIEWQLNEWELTPQ